MAHTPVIVGSERNCDYTIKRVQKLFYRLTKAWQHASIANSHSGAAFNGRELGYPAGHYRVVHNGVNTERFRPGNGAGLRAKLGLSDENVLVGMFGSFKEQKNHRLLFRVAAELLRGHGECRFLLVGDQLHGGMHGSDEYKLGLDRLVDELGIRDHCRFVGNQPHVEEYYRVCDVTVLPSLHEGMPNVVLESLASGVPVVATDVADNALLIAHERVGLLVPSQDAAALGGAMRRLLDDSGLRRRYGEEAVRWIAANFSADAMARKAAEVYSALLGPAQTNRAG
jgi:glycosyltransferase involved in cell wall biosynthesis